MLSQASCLPYMPAWAIAHAYRDDNPSWLLRVCFSIWDPIAQGYTCLSPAMFAGEGLLKDDRFLLRAAQLWETMCDDHRYILEVKPVMWKWLSEIVGYPDGADPDLRSQVVWSSLAALGYSFRDSFERLERLPLSLTQGDLDNNLQALAKADYTELVDEFSKSMRMCIEIGVERSVLVSVLKLCREAPCCTNLVEQGHGSGAATLKAHSQFGTRSLQARASLHQCRSLFSTPVREKLVQRLDDQMARKTKSINGPRYSATQAFLKCLQRDPYHERPKGMDATSWARRCLVEHRSKYEKLTWQQKMEFQAEADVIDMQRRRAWQEELQCLQERKTLVLQQLREDKEDLADKPNLVSAHRLDAEALRRCADVVASYRASSTLDMMREQLLKSAKAPDDAMIEMLRGRAGLFEKPMTSPPHFIRTIALNRDEFYGIAVFLSTDDSGDLPNHIYMLVVALQRPFSVVWLRLDRVPVVWRGDLGQRAKQHLPNLVPEFTFAELKFTSDLELFSERHGELWVAEGLEFGFRASVFAPCSPVLFRSFTRHLVSDPAPPRTHRTRPRRRAARSIRAKLLDEYPWLTSVDLDGACEKLSDKGDDEEDSGNDASDREIDEEAYQRARQEILLLRAEFAVHDEDKFFYVRQRGGDANVAKVGRALDCAAMFARKGVAMAFCNKFDFPKQKSYHYSKHGGRCRRTT